MTQPNIPFDLKEWRERNKLRQKELANLFGVSTPQIWRLEQKGNIPKVYLWAIKGYEAYKLGQASVAPAGRTA